MQILVFGKDRNTLKWINEQVISTTQYSFAVNASTLPEALMLLKSVHFDAVIYDIPLSRNHSKESLKELIQISGAVPVIVLTSVLTLPAAVEAVEAGADTYLLKETTEAGKFAEYIRMTAFKKLDYIRQQTMRVILPHVYKDVEPNMLRY